MIGRIKVRNRRREEKYNSLHRNQNDKTQKLLHIWKYSQLDTHKNREKMCGSVISR